jgi:hypothetical protein
VSKLWTAVPKDLNITKFDTGNVVRVPFFQGKGMEVLMGKYLILGAVSCNCCSMRQEKIMSHNIRFCCRVPTGSTFGASLRRI